MKHRTRSCHNPIALAVATALGGTIAGPLLAAPIEPGSTVGSPLTLFDTATESPDILATLPVKVAYDADGDGFAVWTTKQNLSDDEGTFRRAITLHRILPDGSLGDAVTVAETDDAGTEYRTIDVAVDADGDAVVAWEEFRDLESPETDTLEIHARRFGSDGVPKADAFRVSDPGDQGSAPAVAMDAAGNFTIAWQNDGVEVTLAARRYSAEGVEVATIDPQAGALDDTTPLPMGTSTLMDMNPKGDLVIAWHDDTGVFARTYDAAGNAGEILGPLVPAHAAPVPVIAGTLANAVAMDADGDFALAWSDYEKYADLTATPPEVSLGMRMRAARFQADGTAINEPVELYLGGGLVMPDMGMEFDANGNPVASWIVAEVDLTVLGIASLSSSIVRMNADGSLADIDLGFGCEADSETCLVLSSLALDADGDMLAGYFLGGEKVNEITGLRAQRFRGPESADLSATLQLSPADASPGDNVTLSLDIENLHPLSDHYGVASVDNAVGATSGVTLDFTLPAGLDISLAGDDWTCGTETENVSCAYAGRLLAGEEILFETAFEIPAGVTGEHVLGVSVSSDRVDPDTANNASEVTLSVQSAPDSQPVGGGNGGGALGWLALLLAPLVRKSRVN